MKSQSFSSAIAVILIHIMKVLKLMPFLSMTLSISVSQSSHLVNELTRKSSTVYQPQSVSQSASQFVSKLVSREVSKSVSKSDTSQSVSQQISWSCVKVNQNTMTENFLCNKGIRQEYGLSPLLFF